MTDCLEFLRVSYNRDKVVYEKVFHIYANDMEKFRAFIKFNDVKIYYKNKIYQNSMRINIDLTDDVAKTLNVMAAQSDTDRKNYIQSVLVTHAGGGFKDKKPSTKRKLKH